MVDDDSLACGQRQTKQVPTEPVDVAYGRDGVFTNGLVSEEYRAVEDDDQVQNLAEELSHVADHHELIGVLDRLTQHLVTLTKFSDVSMELLAAAANGAMEILVQCSKLVVQDASDHVVH